MAESEPGIKWRRDGDPQRIEEREVGLGMSAYMHVRYINGERTAVTAIAPSGRIEAMSVKEEWIYFDGELDRSGTSLAIILASGEGPMVLGVTVIWE